jgi:hypothetical protein
MEEKMHSLQIEDRNRLRERIKNSHNQTILVPSLFVLYSLFLVRAESRGQECQHIKESARELAISDFLVLTNINEYE